MHSVAIARPRVALVPVAVTLRPPVILPIRVRPMAAVVVQVVEILWTRAENCGISCEYEI